MSNITELIINLGFWIAMIFAVLSMFFLSRIIKIEHDDFREQWKKDGSPHAMPFWYSVKDGLGFSGPWSKGYQWLFKTPDWIKKHKKGSRMLSYFRFTQMGAFFILFVIAATIFITAPK